MVMPMVLAEVSPALGPLLVAALLLVVAGWEKLGRPAPTALALARAGVRVPDAAVQLLGLVEIVVAAVAVVAGGVAGAAVAVLYLGFAGFTARQVVVARATGEAADCGCFGDSSAPVGWTHVVVNVLLAVGGVAAAVAGAEGLAAAGWPAAAVCVVAAIAAVGVRGLLTDLPRVQALRRAADA